MPSTPDRRGADDRAARQSRIRARLPYRRDGWRRRRRNRAPHKAHAIRASGRPDPPRGPSAPASRRSARDRPETSRRAASRSASRSRAPRGAWTGPCSASWRANLSIAPASTSLASACVGTPKPGTSMPMMRTPLISLGRSRSGTPEGGRHAKIDDDDRVVLGGIGELEDRLADVLEQLSGDQRFRIERNVADRALRAVEMRGEREPVDATGGAGQNASRCAACADRRAAIRMPGTCSAADRAARPDSPSRSARASRSCPRLWRRRASSPFRRDNPGLRAAAGKSARSTRRRLARASFRSSSWRNLRHDGHCSGLSSDRVVDDFERRLRLQGRAAHVGHRGGLQRRHAVRPPRP